MTAARKLDADEVQAIAVALADEIERRRLAPRVRPAKLARVTRKATSEEIERMARRLRRKGTR